MRLLKLTSTVFYSLNSTRTFTTKLSTQSFVARSAHYFQMGSLLRRNPGVFMFGRIFSSVAHSISCSGNGGGGNEEDQTSKAVISVRAFFFSTSVNLRTLVESHKQNFILPSSLMTNYVVLGFGNGLGANLSESDGCYMVVFPYGSIVLFNILDHEVDEYLKIVERHASGLLPEMRKKEYEVREEPTLNTLVQHMPDYIMLQYLNIERIRIIGSVLGQSIALDYYIHQVDAIIVEFSKFNCGMVDTGTIKVEQKKMYQLVGKANSNLLHIILKFDLFERRQAVISIDFIDVPLKLMLNDLEAASICDNGFLWIIKRSDIAWKDAEYAKIWEYLRDKFDLTKRFASLESKFKFVEHNILFHAQILSRQSKIMDWLHYWFD